MPDREHLPADGIGQGSEEGLDLRQVGSCPEAHGEKTSLFRGNPSLSMGTFSAAMYVSGYNVVFLKCIGAAFNTLALYKLGKLVWLVVSRGNLYPQI